MATGTTRKKIPDPIQAQILIESKRRCCLCFHLSGDKQIKNGQIAHINKKNSDNNPENLAFLCFDHHDNYDSSRSQSKGITVLEILHAKKALIEELSTNSQRSVRITISVEGDFEKLTPQERRELLSNALSKVELRDNVEVLDIKPGSVKFTVKITGEDALRLLNSYNNNQLNESGIRNIGIAPAIEKNSIRFLSEFNDLSNGISKRDVFNIVLNPDSVEDLERFYNNPPLDPALKGVKLYLKQMSFKYSVFILAIGSPKDMGIICAFPFSNTLIKYNRGENPWGVLEQFIIKYGLSVKFNSETMKLRINQEIHTPVINNTTYDLSEYMSKIIRAQTDENLSSICIFEPPEIMGGNLKLVLMFVILKEKYYLSLKNIGIKPKYKDSSYFCITHKSS